MSMRIVVLKEADGKDCFRRHDSAIDNSAYPPLHYKNVSSRLRFQIDTFLLNTCETILRPEVLAFGAAS